MKLSSAIPEYPYPYQSGSMLREASQAVEEWENLLDSISSATDSELEIRREELLGHASWLMNAVKRGEWRILDDPQMPRDARTDFIYYPTCLGLATLAAIRSRLGVDDVKLNMAIIGVSKKIQRHGWWMGSGYDRYCQMCKNLSAFEKGGLIAMWQSDSTRFEKICSALTAVAESMIADPGAWTGDRSGYFKVSEREYSSILGYLKPLVGERAASESH